MEIFSSTLEPIELSTSNPAGKRLAYRCSSFPAFFSLAPKCFYKALLSFPLTLEESIVQGIFITGNLFISRQPQKKLRFSSLDIPNTTCNMKFSSKGKDQDYIVSITTQIVTLLPQKH